MKIICFDIGGTKILKAILKMTRKKYEFLGIDEQKNPQNPKKIESIILDYCYAARKKYWLKKVAVSTAGIVDAEKKMVFPTGSFGNKEFYFSFLEKENFSVRVENDGRCFASGEYLFGKAKDAASVLSLSLGTYIGGGYLLKGKNLQGAHSSSLEVSHFLISHEGRWKKWGGFSGGHGIEETYFRSAKKKLSCKEIFKLAKRKDKSAENAIKQAALFLGIGVSNLCDILDPELIVFGGSLTMQKKFLAEAIKIAKKNVFNKKAKYKFAISSLGNRANLLGAASLYK